MEMEAPRKLRLRRVVPAQKNQIKDEFLIQKNLEQLKANTEKKKRAQEAYYENYSSSIHVSPLNRDFNRRPVKQRLGRRIPFNGTNTSAIPPKRRLLRVKATGTMNNSINARKSRNTRFSAQQRLNQIRARHQNTGMQPQGGPRRFKLKRTLVNGFPNGLMNNSMPKNFQVEVKNERLYQDRSNFYQGNHHRFKQILNHHVQMEIKRIQMEFQGNTTIMPTKVTPVSTRISTSLRFAQLT